MNLKLRGRMLMMMIINCDSCCLTVPLITLLDKSASGKKKTQQKHKKNEKSLNKSRRAAWPSMVCPGPVSHVLVWFDALLQDLRFIAFVLVFSILCGHERPMNQCYIPPLRPREVTFINIFKKVHVKEFDRHAIYAPWLLESPEDCTWLLLTWKGVEFHLTSN